ncbi:hypothetical protein QFZ63_003228 [Streptomyces sp. B3I7]|uniref:ATP-binding protein n=1 Tax=Streptomyces sp. B3I7 TaxID=3042269 RepID=UPI00278935FE|nr:ATP-binding protein [Streptomyces sp. B3I7]MDQ0811514.1 hypothetical protein [Streptomyces sp. B3I7]
MFETLSAPSLPRCPVGLPHPVDAAAPRPETLAYSLTLPAALTSPALARQVTRALLTAHGLGGMLDPAVLAVSELTATAARFTQSADFHLSLRYRADTLRLTVYDNHPHHAHPRLADACETRRRAALRLLTRLCRTCGGACGFEGSREPGGGTRMWATLPRR